MSFLIPPIGTAIGGRARPQERLVLIRASRPRRPRQTSHRASTRKSRHHQEHHLTMAEREPLAESTPPVSSQIQPSSPNRHHDLHQMGHVSTRNFSTSNRASALLPLPIAFYDYYNPQPDNRGRTLSEILSWDDDDLERSHNYIQYLFPLLERSPFNPDAPLITREVFEAFRAHSDEGQGLRHNLDKAFRRMLTFYGFKTERLHTPSSLDSGPQQDLIWTIVRSEDYKARFKEWVRKFDHNHLRITRIIRCLRLLGLGEWAHIFHDTLVRLSNSRDYGGKIGKKSLMFWERAAERRLWNPPEADDERTVGTGCEFLVEWEREKGEYKHKG